MNLRIATLLTCHNRREKTLDCLRALRAQTSAIYSFHFSAAAASPPSSVIRHPSSAISHPSSVISHSSPAISIEIFLVDDGSTDGTADAVREIWPQAQIIQGHGSLFWCGGMRLAWQQAALTNPDYYLLLNDDTNLFPNALETLLVVVENPGKRRIVVAAIQDPATGKLVYGGRTKKNFQLSGKANIPLACATMNTNCGLVPRAVFEELGAFHPAYTHSMGDYDYGLEASRNGIDVWQAPGVLGVAECNSIRGTWRDRSLPIRKRLFLLHRHPKGLPIAEWAIFCRRNYGCLWPLKILSPTLRVLLGK